MKFLFNESNPYTTNWVTSAVSVSNNYDFATGSYASVKVYNLTTGRVKFDLDKSEKWSFKLGILV